MGPLTGSLLGLLLGMRHALEPDHLAAVSTLLTDAKSSRKSALLGAFWGMGHTLSLVAVGVVLMVLQGQMPEAIAARLELGVAAMLLVLGGVNLYRAFTVSTEKDSSTHRHNGLVHTHGPALPHVHLRDWTVGVRPLLVGVVHGLAGSGALTALALSQAQSSGARVVYMLLFGVGSMLGMSVLAGVLGMPLSGLMRRPRVRPVLTGLTGVLSMALGVAWGWPLLGL